MDSLMDLVDLMTRDAMQFWNELMNELTDGALSKGWRPATGVERIIEWDSLTPEQLELLRERMGDEWVWSQAGEIEKLRQQVMVT